MRKNLKDFIDRVSNRLKGRVKEEDYPLGMEGDPVPDFEDMINDDDTEEDERGYGKLPKGIIIPSNLDEDDKEEKPQKEEDKQ